MGNDGASPAASQQLMLQHWIKIWFVVWNILYFIPYIGNNIPNRLIFSRGIEPPTRNGL